MNWLIAHLVGDYLAQNDWMALNKKRHTWHCVVHCMVYTATLELFTGWPIWAFAIVFVTHFIQDRTDVIRGWMKMVGQEKFLTGPCAPWSSIVVDNVWHLWLLYAVSLIVEKAK